MVELDQYKYQWNQYKDSVKELEASFNIEVKKERLEEIEASMEEQDFWEDVEKSQKLTKEMKQLKNSLDTINGLVEQYNEIGVLIEMGEEEEDLSIVDEVENELKDFKTKINGENNHERKDMRYRFLYTGALLRQQ